MFNCEQDKEDLCNPLQETTNSLSHHFFFPASQLGRWNLKLQYKLDEIVLWSGRTDSYLHMNQLSLRNNRLKFKIAGKLPIILEEYIAYTPIQ